MKVLYCTRDYSPHDERFLTALAKTALEVFCLRFEPTAAVTLPAGIREVKLPLPARTQQERNASLRSLLEKLQPDLVHAGPLHQSAYQIALTGFSPLVSMSWGADIQYDGERDAEAQNRIRTTLENSTVLLGDCQAVAEMAVKRYGYPRERIFLFPWGVDLNHFTPAGSSDLRNSLGWNNHFVFLSNRSFEPIYGVDISLRAFLLAARENPSIRLLLLGKGSQEEKLREIISTSEFSDRIYFGGYQSLATLPDVYRSADVFLSASHCDGSSVSLMEALACGLPALVSDIPGNQEWIETDSNGWIFRDNDIQHMANLMLSISQDAVLPEKRLRARAVAEAKADWHKNFPVLLDAYQAAINLSGKKPNLMESL